MTSEPNHDRIFSSCDNARDNLKGILEDLGLQSMVEVVVAQLTAGTAMIMKNAHLDQRRELLNTLHKIISHAESYCKGRPS